MTPARTRLLLIVLLFAVVNLGPAHAVATGRGLDANQASSVVVTNVLLLAAVWMFLVLRGRTRPELRMVATRELTRTDEEVGLERIHLNDYVVRGEVTMQDGDQVLLAVADRTVRVTLDGHTNPAGTGEVVEVRGTMVG